MFGEGSEPISLSLEAKCEINNWWLDELNCHGDE